MNSAEIGPEKVEKQPKRGIIYISSIPPYMNVTQIREYFGKFGTVGRVFLQIDNKVDKEGKIHGKKSKKKGTKKFSEGWIEFERKSVAKKVAQLLNNTQVSNRKKSKQYDCLWNIKYLSGFKWTHLHERLAYEKAARRQKLRTEIQLAKRSADYFSRNLRKKNEEDVNKEYKNLKDKVESKTQVDETPVTADRNEFLGSLFSV
ncbi:hypothetical protein WA026_003625 [Henosepilachna vigintioctopunctata]|uniref:Activator of basal transcription 1 n=1 Tax=Henosepilachna vigintioctopunctata TaxID=420089 RepID=A0AAW1TRX7_9CUCU